ncbi:MAG: OB-fold domain-containing protein [Sphingomicrobium sp.]
MGPDAQFRAFLAEGRFMIQRGVESGTPVFYPRAVAPFTGEALMWVPASGRGTVYATTVTRRRSPEPTTNVALVELEEGPRLMSRIDGIDPAAVRIGMSVVARIISESDAPLLIFEPAP